MYKFTSIINDLNLSALSMVTFQLLLIIIQFVQKYVYVHYVLSKQMFCYEAYCSAGHNGRALTFIKL